MLIVDTGKAVNRLGRKPAKAGRPRPGSRWGMKNRETQMRNRIFVRGLWRRSAGRHLVPAPADARAGCGGSRDTRLLPGEKLMRSGGNGMRIVIVKSPKMFSGILRKLFGIKKESYIE